MKYYKQLRQDQLKTKTAVNTIPEEREVERGFSLALLLFLLTAFTS